MTDAESPGPISHGHRVEVPWWYAGLSALSVIPVLYLFAVDSPLAIPVMVALAVVFGYGTRYVAQGDTDA